MKSKKQLVYNSIVAKIEQKIQTAQTAIEIAKESRDNDTKSSAGDKFETGREMMQIEIENNKLLLNKALTQLNELKKIDLQKDYSKVEFGSLVITNNGSYFFSIAEGKIEVDSGLYYAVSMISPLGKLLNSKVVGDEIMLNNKMFRVDKII